MGGPGPPLTAATALSADEVHVWMVRLGAGPVGIVPLDHERQRAERMLDDRARSRFLASRAWLRAVLARYLGVDPGAVRLTVAAGGKPSVADRNDVAFSLSRSGDRALVAVTRGRPVGVDVERVRGDVDDDVLAARLFAVGEARWLRDLPAPDRSRGFFRLWTRKEAVVKATGAGLGAGIAHLDVREDAVEGCTVRSLDVGPGVAAAVAVVGSMGTIATRTLGEPDS